MSRRQIPILPIIALLAIGAGLYGLYKNITFEEVEYEVMRSAEARSNSLLAAGFLLNTEDFIFDVKKTRRVFTELDDSDGVLWLTDARELDDKREAEKIIAWVESGGILLTSPAGINGLDTNTISGWMLEQFGIVELDEEPDGVEIELSNSLSEDDVAKNDYSEQDTENDWETITLPDSSLNANIRIFSDYDPYFQIAKSNPNNLQTIIDSPFLIHRALGDGYVAVYADEELFDSDRFGDEDQGYLLLWLTQPAKNKTVSMVFNPASSPGLFTVLWSKFTLAICLFGLALAGFLRWASSRLGPIEQELPPIKNNIMEHLEARGEFWYRHKYTDKILDNVQIAAQENMLSQAGMSGTGSSVDSHDKTALIKQASKQLQCSPKQAEQVLFGQAKNDVSLLKMSRDLQRLNHFKQYKPQ